MKAKYGATLKVWLAGGMMAGCLALGTPLYAQQQSPEALIEDSVTGFMADLEKREDYYTNNVDELKKLVDESLEDVADFRYIGASVMGRYFRNATPKQRRRFVEEFRQTLIDTYTKGLTTLDYDELRMAGEQTAQRDDDRASVKMEVVAQGGDVYPVSYSLRLDDDQWKVVNVIVNGINLGLTFRNQFDQAMRENNRDYDAVIRQWSPDVGADELEEGGSE